MSYLNLTKKQKEVIYKISLATNAQYVSFDCEYSSLIFISFYLSASNIGAMCYHFGFSFFPLELQSIFDYKFEFSIERTKKHIQFK